MRTLLFFLAFLPLGAAESHSVMAVFAHPDDETTVGPLLARSIKEGHQVWLVAITSGQKGATPHSKMQAGDQLGAVREDELRCSAQKLGLAEPQFLKYQDGGLSDPRTMESFAAKVRELIEKYKPEVLITWGPDGTTGHPDHRAASAVTTQIFQQRGLLKHHPSKLYYVSFPESLFSKPIGSRRRPFNAVSDAFITTIVDCRKGLAAGQASIECHKTQWTAEQMKEQQDMHEKILGGRIFLRLALSGAPAKTAAEIW